MASFSRIAFLRYYADTHCMTHHPLFVGGNVLIDLLGGEELGEEGGKLLFVVEDVVDLVLMTLEFVFSADNWSEGFLLRFLCSFGEMGSVRAFRSL